MYFLSAEYQEKRKSRKNFVKKLHKSITYTRFSDDMNW
jgi:hypothetical protein